jgi:hypothetical protein
MMHLKDGKKIQQKGNCQRPELTCGTRLLLIENRIGTFPTMVLEWKLLKATKERPTQLLRFFHGLDDFLLADDFSFCLHFPRLCSSTEGTLPTIFDALATFGGS